MLEDDELGARAHLVALNSLDQVSLCFAVCSALDGVLNSLDQVSLCFASGRGRGQQCGNKPDRGE